MNRKHRTIIAYALQHAKELKYTISGCYILDDDQVILDAVILQIREIMGNKQSLLNLTVHLHTNKKNWRTQKQINLLQEALGYMDEIKQERDFTAVRKLKYCLKQL